VLGGQVVQMRSVFELVGSGVGGLVAFFSFSFLSFLPLSLCWFTMRRVSGLSSP